MKTKTFFLLCLFLSFGLTQLSAQPAIGKSGNLFITFIWDGYSENVPLNCNYNTIDVLVGTVSCYTVYHWSNYDGNPYDWEWCWQLFHGELKSQLTQEVFKIADILKSKGPVSAAIPGRGHFIAIGNRGTRYIVNYIWDIDHMIFVNVKCPGDN